MQNKIEILAPAGDMESIIAGVQNGANAVYLGLQQFSARQNAKNFDIEQLKQAVTYCHTRGVSVFVAFNTIVFDTEIELLKQQLIQVCDCGVDAIIIQDLAVFSLLKNSNMPIHASTQMSIHSQLGAKAVKNLGFERVVLAREMSVSEIENITSNVDIQTEVFVHGALCMSVSGQCYMSAMIGTRSANRGSCAGTCRLPFSTNLHTKATDYALSLKDLCFANDVQQLIDIGVSSVKIEGRMKRPEYVACASGEYSKVVGGELPDIELLQSVFSRQGFTDGYLKGKVGTDMFGSRTKQDVVSTTTKILKSLNQTYQKEKQVIPLTATLVVGENATLTFSANGVQKSITEPSQQAQTKSLTEEVAQSYISKLGGTIFSLEKLDCQIQEGYTLTASTINSMRRTLCEQISAELEQNAIKPRTNKIAQVDTTVDTVAPLPMCFVVNLNSKNQLPETTAKNTLVVLPVDQITDSSQFAKFDRFNTLSPQEMTDRLKKSNARGIYAQNLADIQLATELGLEWYGSHYLNCSNSLALREYAKMPNCIGIDMSVEMTETQMNNMAKPVAVGLVGYGKLPLMLTRNCPIKDCNSCKLKLIDRTSTVFEVVCHKKKLFEIINCRPLNVLNKTSQFKGISYVSMHFTNESKEQVQSVIEGALSKTAPTGEFTRGLYYRGVIQE